jgi:hypothetical protein
MMVVVVMAGAMFVIMVVFVNGNFAPLRTSPSGQRGTDQGRAQQIGNGRRPSIRNSSFQDRISCIHSRVFARRPNVCDAPPNRVCREGNLCR